MRPRNSASILAAAAVVALMLFASACTEAEDTRLTDGDTLAQAPGMFPDTTASMDMMAATDTVDVSLVEHRIEMPANLSAGMTAFNITNNGTTEHNFEIEGQGIEEMLTTSLQPGESGTLSVHLQEGTYTVYCPVGDHRDMGMELTVTVNQAATGLQP